MSDEMEGQEEQSEPDLVANLLNNLEDDVERDEEDEEVNDDDFPWLKCVFTPNGIIVTMNEWSKINTRLLEKSLRATYKHRNILRQQAIRKMHIGNKKEIIDE